MRSRLRRRGRLRFVRDASGGFGDEPIRRIQMAQGCFQFSWFMNQGFFPPFIFISSDSSPVRSTSSHSTLPSESRSLV